MIYTFLLSLLHLLVDGICACGLMLMSRQIVSDTEAYGMIVLYDVLAFGTQPLTGRWIDRGTARQHGMKPAAALLVGGAMISTLHISPTNYMVATGAVLLGMGNSFFHVYGGRYVALTSHYDIRGMGVFVSTGAVGLAIGLNFSSLMLLAVFLFAFLVLVFLHLHYDDKLQHIPAPPNTYHPTPNQTSAPILYLCCLMLVVAGRACIGEAVPSLHINLLSISAPMLMVVVSLIVMVGKAAGGFLSKRWGVRKVLTYSMLLSAAFFLLCPWHNGFVLITLFLMNLSMPCTLYLATKAVPGREGWTFGLLAMSLLPGYLLGYLSKDNATCQALLVPLMATIVLESLLLLYLRERRWQVLATSVVLNIFTNVPLNAFIMSCRVTSPFILVGLECVVVMVEFFGFWLVLQNRFKAFKYSFLCNSFSVLVGCLCQLLLSLISW